MSLTYQRSRITGAGLVAAQYDLTLERQTIMDNILFIPGIANPVSEINQLLFGQGQQGTFIAPSLTASLISGSTFGTGVETLPDLSPRNNPFSQATPSSRGAWFREPKTGRRNLFLDTEEVNEWVTATDATITSNATTNPFGGNNADLVTPTAGLSNKRLAWSLTSSATKTFSFYAKSNGWQFIGSNPSNSNGGPVFDIINGTVTNTNSEGVRSAIITNAGNGWFRCEVRYVSFSSNNFNIVFLDGSANFIQTTAATGDGVLGAYLWGRQLDDGVLAATAYQRVTTAFDVTEQGQRDCYGVRADGTDDGYETAGNVDFSGTNKVTVFAAVRKRSDSLTQTVVELSVNSDTNNGSFWLRAPAASGANSYRFTSRGTSTQSAGTGAFAPAPDIAIVTSEADISSPFVRLRRNGTLIEQVTASQGTGNYGNYQMFLCARAGTSNLLNGDIFALIIAGGSYPLSTIQRVERLLSRITPTVNL